VPWRHLILLFLSLFVMMAGFGIVIPVLPFLARDLGATPVELGLMVSVWAGAQFLCAPLWGAFSDRSGRKVALIIGLAGLGATQFLITLTSSVSGLLAARALGGVLSSATMPAASAYIADVTHEKDRGQAMALMGAAFASGFALGPAIGGVLAPLGVMVPFYAAGVMGFGAALLTALILPETRRPAATGADAPRRRSNPLAVFKSLRSPYGVFLCLAFAISFAGSSMFSMLSYFIMDRFGGTATDAGLAFTVHGLTSMVLQGLVVGRVLRSIGESRSLQLGLAIGAAGYILVAMSFGMPTLLLAVVLAASSMAFAKPSAMSAVSKRTDLSQGITMGMYASCESLGRMAGPLWAGMAFAWSTGAPYYSAAVVMIVGVLALQWVVSGEAKVAQPQMMVPANDG
jgi:MFS transporter, DHA1 family, multidrug resistance protein